MKKVSRRSVSLIVLIVLLIFGLTIFIIRFFINAEDWAMFTANKNIYKDGYLNSGAIFDRNGVPLLTIDNGEYVYAEDKAVRKATLHAIGDKQGNIGTSAIKSFKEQIVGYDFVNGTFSIPKKDAGLYLTIDSQLCAYAYEKLNGKSGTIAIYNYKTGEILCMVSSPTYDPSAPPEIKQDDISGVYINRFLSSKYTPGSIFKIVTLAAAIENIDDIYDRRFTCEGSVDVAGEKLACSGVHGEMTIEEAFAMSCNCAFASLALELGTDLLNQYAEDFGLTESFEIDGIKTAAGNFELAEDGSSNLAWSGIGQYNNLINPAAMLRLMGSIANDGKAIEPTIIYDKSNGIIVEDTKSNDRLVDKDTANAIKSMMNFNVHYNYGIENFPNLTMHAKSGTAEVGGDKEPHAWFVGFIEDEENPLAFIVTVENGGSGSLVAGTIANSVLQMAVNSEK